MDAPPDVMQVRNECDLPTLGNASRTAHIGQDHIGSPLAELVEELPAVALGLTIRHRNVQGLAQGCISIHVFRGQRVLEPARAGPFQPPSGSHGRARVVHTVRIDQNIRVTPDRLDHRLDTIEILVEWTATDR